MKRVLWILSWIIYLFSANALVHASTMGFFDHKQISSSHCHQIHTSTNETTPDQNNIDCCELVYSNEYSNTKLSLKTFCQNYFSVAPINLITQEIKKITHISTIIHSPPWRKTDNKLNNFSDLVWIIVNLI